MRCEVYCVGWPRLDAVPDPEHDYGRRGALLVEVITGVVESSLTPLSHKAVAAAVGKVLDDAWADFATDEVPRAIETALASDRLTDDPLGRLMPFDRSQPRGLGDISSGTARAEEAAVALAAIEAPRLLPGDPEAEDEAHPPRRLFATPLLTAKVERSLAQRIERGDREALGRLVEANTRLAASVANASRRQSTAGHGADDLFQEALLGVIRAAEKFDFRRGFKFSTYATWWIRQAISRSIADKGVTIRIPVHVWERRLPIEQVRLDLARQGGCVSAADIAEVLEVPAAEVQAILNLPHVSQSLDVLLDQTPGDGWHRSDEIALRSPSLCRVLVDGDPDHPEAWTEAILVRETIYVWLNELTYRERRVIEMRYGLDWGGVVRTLDEIGCVFGITRERIRQIENRSLQRILVIAQASFGESARRVEHEEVPAGKQRPPSPPSKAIVVPAESPRYPEAPNESLDGLPAESRPAVRPLLGGA